MGTQVLVNWKPVPSESLLALARDGLRTIALHADRPDDGDDSGALIRTLRPIDKVCIES